MHVAEGVVKMFCQPENDAPNESRGTDHSEATSTTTRPAPSEEVTLYPASSSSAKSATEASTKDHSGVLLSEEEGIRLFRIRKDSRLGHMPMFDDHKLLLDIIARFIP